MNISLREIQFLQPPTDCHGDELPGLVRTVGHLHHHLLLQEDGGGGDVRVPAVTDQTFPSPQLHHGYETAGRHLDTGIIVSS